MEKQNMATLTFDNPIISSDHTSQQTVTIEFLPGESTIDERVREIDAELCELDANIDTLNNNADNLDYLAAVGSGIITGLIDILFVGRLDINIIQPDILVSKEKIADTIQTIIQKVAESKNYSGSSDGGAIHKLENSFSTIQDNVWKGADIGVTAKSHHLDDLAHHPSILGLTSAIAVEFLRFSFFQDKNGKNHILLLETDYKLFLETRVAPIIISGLFSWLSYVAENYCEEELDSEIPKPIKNIISLVAATPILLPILKIASNWAGHLLSDINGSQKTPKQGMGIPGLFISFLKEACMFVPGLNKTELPAFVDNLYQNKHIDFRAELAFTMNAVKSVGQAANVVGILLKEQILPVTINEILIRSFYFIRHLICELKETGCYENINWKNTLPFGNRTIVRMMTIATGTFAAIDIMDAGIEGAIHSGGNWVGFGKEFVLRLNFVGIGRFTVAGITDIAMGAQKGKKSKERMQLKNDVLHLMNVKLYQGDVLLWEAAKDATDSIETFYSAIKTISASISRDMTTAKHQISAIGQANIDQIEAKNSDLIADILREL